MNVNMPNKQPVFSYDTSGVFVEITRDRGDYSVTVQYDDALAGAEGRHDAFDAAIAELEHMQRGCAYLIGRLRTEKAKGTPAC